MSDSPDVAAVETEILNRLLEAVKKEEIPEMLKMTISNYSDFLYCCQLRKSLFESRTDHVTKTGPTKEELLSDPVWVDAIRQLIKDNQP